jgi:thiol-disulfide isomerase/thioredoxin
MTRAFRGWCVVFVLGVVAGCAGNSTETTGGKTDAAKKPAAKVLSSPDGSVRLTSPCQFDAVEKAIADAKGKVVLIDCWATWCPPCVASFPQLVEKHKKYAEKGLAVISVSLDDIEDDTEVLAFLVKQKATFTNLHTMLDATGSKGLTDRLSFRSSIPHAALFDRSGNRVWAGNPMDPTLTAQVEAELAKPAPPQG